MLGKKKCNKSKKFKIIPSIFSDKTSRKLEITKGKLKKSYIPENHEFIKIMWSKRLPLVVKNLPATAGDARDTGWIPGLGRSYRVGNGNTFQYTCLENP